MKIVSILVSLFCPADKDYYIGIFILALFINFYKICVICLQLPFFSLRTNTLALQYSVYELFMLLIMVFLPFIPESIQVLLPFAIVLLIQLPMRLSKHFISHLLPRLIKPIRSTRASKPGELLLFTSLLSFYKEHIQDIKQANNHCDADELSLLMILVGIMAKHSLPSCSVVDSY